VDLNYIQPFSEIAILYEVDSCRKVENMVPQKMDAETARKLRKEIQGIERALPSGD